MNAFGFLAGIHPVLQALLATLFTWAVTAIGAGMVFFFKSLNRKLLDAMLGFAGGVMIAASFWSLLAPSIELAEEVSLPGWLPAVVGFLAGGVFLRLVDRILPHLHLGEPVEKAEGLKTTWKKSVLLILAITLHNIPEGLAVGVAFGAVAAGIPGTSLGAAVALAIGIGLQNFPEGAAVSVPLRREGYSRRKSFFFGQLSGVVEPIAGVIGAAVALSMRSLLPFALAFAAGAMIFVVVEEVIPESQGSGNTHIATLGAMLGFALMMFLDVSLG
ncbi:MAG: ZIP family metal transporter [Spirochaetales bacterium]|nr:ZIP family metal transporter [Spirochaetales bacterium]